MTRQKDPGFSSASTDRLANSDGDRWAAGHGNLLVEWDGGQGRAVAKKWYGKRLGTATPNGGVSITPASSNVGDVINAAIEWAADDLSQGAVISLHPNLHTKQLGVPILVEHDGINIYGPLRQTRRSPWYLDASGLDYGFRVPGVSGDSADNHRRGGVYGLGLDGGGGTGDLFSIFDGSLWEFKYCWAQNTYGHGFHFNDAGNVTASYIRTNGCGGDPNGTTVQNTGKASIRAESTNRSTGLQRCHNWKVSSRNQAMVVDMGSGGRVNLSNSIIKAGGQGGIPGSIHIVNVSSGGIYFDNITLTGEEGNAGDSDSPALRIDTGNFGTIRDCRFEKHENALFMGNGAGSGTFRGTGFILTGAECLDTDGSSGVLNGTGFDHCAFYGGDEDNNGNIAAVNVGSSDVVFHMCSIGGSGGGHETDYAVESGAKTVRLHKCSLDGATGILKNGAGSAVSLLSGGLFTRDEGSIWQTSFASFPQTINFSDTFTAEPRQNNQGGLKIDIIAASGGNPPYWAECNSFSTNSFDFTVYKGDGSTATGENITLNYRAWDKTDWKNRTF